MDSLKPPSWTNRETHKRSVAKVTRIIVLYELYRKGRILDVAATKGELSKLMNTNRWSLDRDLATLADAIEQADKLLASLK